MLSRRLHAVHGNRIAVVNAGIGGNQIVQLLFDLLAALRSWRGGPLRLRLLRGDAWFQTAEARDIVESRREGGRLAVV